jgi:hypothetical protein
MQGFLAVGLSGQLLLLVEEVRGRVVVGKRGGNSRLVAKRMTQGAIQNGGALLQRR